MLVYLDFETFSTVPIQRGTYPYMEGAEVLLAAYSVDEDPEVTVVDVAGRLPAEQRELLAYLLHLIKDPATKVVAHNAMFERLVLRELLGVDLPASKFWCTMAQAYSNALPGGLDALANALGVTVGKDPAGQRLIRLFCQTDKKGGRATAATHSADWAHFQRYCCLDVHVGREVHRAMPSRNYSMPAEYAFWCEDQRINDTGLAIDTDFCDRAIEVLKLAKADVDGKLSQATNGAVSAATKGEKLLLHILAEYGVLLESLRADELERLLTDDRLPEEVRQLLELRLVGAMSSTAKYSRLARSVSADGRLRGTRQWNGAGRTGRSAGRIFNPYNLRRPSMHSSAVEACIEAVKLGQADLVPLFAPHMQEALSNALRGLIIAPPGRKLVVSDWSNIEGRMAAWLCGERWKLDAFRAFDAGEGPDLYKLAAARAYVKDVALVDGYERQQGKAMELLLGYGGGVGAFITAEVSYGLNLEELGLKVPASIPEAIWEQAKRMYQWAEKKGKTFGLSESAYCACEALKARWRAANSRIAGAWSELEEAARGAIAHPGRVTHAARCAMVYRSKWLLVRLPSGRDLMYCAPVVDARGGLSYMGWNNGSWRRVKTYGGKLLENITQAASRDILRDSILEVAKVPDVSNVLDVYDELVVEAPEDGWGLAELSAIMTETPGWAVGLPLAAAGFETRRYAKH